MHVDRSADVHRFRRDFDALRGGGKPEAEHHAGDGDDVPGDRGGVGSGSVRGAIDLAGVTAVSERGHGIRARGSASVGAAVYSCWTDAAGGEFWIGTGSATGCGTIAVRNGKKQRAAKIVFRKSGRQVP